MAYLTKKDPLRFIELGNYAVDFKDEDVLALDHVNDMGPLFPLKPMTSLIAFCYKGSQEIVANGQAITLNEGNILLCPPNTLVSTQPGSNHFSCKVLCISEDLARSLLRDKIEIWHHAIYINQPRLMTTAEGCREDFTFYFALIRSKLRNNNPNAPYDILLALLRAFILEISYMLESTNSHARGQKLSQGKLLFNNFLSLLSGSQVKRQPITYYAGQLAITPKYLTMLCLKYSNKTASEWVAQYTVEEIRFYLKSTDLSIKEISVRMGFSNMSHFGSYVRKHLGVSPSEYRYSKMD